MTAVDAIVKSLPRLERFRRAMWGRDVATIQHTFELYSGEKTLAYKYLDLSEFLDDLRSLWGDLVSPLLIREEYEQVYTVLSDASESDRAGWVITGQPGIGLSLARYINLSITHVLSREDNVLILHPYPPFKYMPTRRHRD